MRTTFHNVLLTITMLVVAHLPMAMAQDFQWIDSLDLPEAVVVANRSAVPLQSVGHTFDIITSTELQRMPVSSVAEALQYISGLDLRQRGPRGVQADLSIRGGTFDQVLVLVNGIKLSDPQTGHHNLYIPVPLEQIDRIEVLKGPGARLYGQNAFAGAINIITKPGEEQKTVISGELGQFGLAGFGVSLSLPKGKFKQTLSYRRDLAQGYEDSTGLRQNTDYDIQHIFYQASTQIDQHSIELLAGIADREFGANGFYASASATQQYEEVQTSILGLSHKTKTSLGAKTLGDFSQRLSWRRNQDDYAFVRSNPSLYRNLHISNVIGYDAYQNVQNKFGRLGLSVEAQSIALRSNLLGDRRRTLLNGLVEQRFEFFNDKLTVTPGVSINYLSDAGSRVLPGLDLLYRASNNLSFYANAGMTYRVPTYTDLYYRDRFNEGNSELVAERAFAYEAGIRYEHGPLELRASAWQREAMDQIDFVLDGPTDSVWQARNISEATFQGVEVQASIKNISSHIPLIRASYNFIDASLPLNAGVEESRYALDNLRHQLLLTAIGKLTKSLSATVSFRAADRITQTTLNNVDVDYQLLDLRLDYLVSRYRFFGEMTNLTNQTYAQANGVPLPGSWLRAGATVSF